MQNLQNEKLAQEQINNGSTGGAAATTAIGPTGTFPSTTVPPPATAPAGCPDDRAAEHGRPGVRNGPLDAMMERATGLGPGLGGRG